jgi:16S rRNA (guanine966-N2)-methyltransferase
MSILGEALVDANALDLFAGSGALGLEALSRGAAAATFVELNPPSLKALESNIAALGVADRVTVHRGDAIRFAQRLSGYAYDIVFADPPYSVDYGRQLIELFRDHPFARILSVEHRSDLDLAGDDTRRYGDTAITFVHAP